MVESLKIIKKSLVEGCSLFFLMNNNFDECVSFGLWSLEWLWGKFFFIRMWPLKTFCSPGTRMRSTKKFWACATKWANISLEARSSPRKKTSSAATATSWATSSSTPSDPSPQGTLPRRQDFFHLLPKPCTYFHVHLIEGTARNFPSSYTLTGNRTHVSVVAPDWDWDLWRTLYWMSYHSQGRKQGLISGCSNWPSR